MIKRLFFIFIIFIIISNIFLFSNEKIQYRFYSAKDKKTILKGEGEVVRGKIGDELEPKVHKRAGYLNGWDNYINKQYLFFCELYLDDTNIMIFDLPFEIDKYKKNSGGFLNVNMVITKNNESYIGGCTANEMKKNKKGKYFLYSIPLVNGIGNFVTLSNKNKKIHEFAMPKDTMLEVKIPKNEIEGILQLRKKTAALKLKENDKLYTNSDRKKNNEIIIESEEYKISFIKEPDFEEKEIEFEEEKIQYFSYSYLQDSLLFSFNIYSLIGTEFENYNRIKIYNLFINKFIEHNEAEISEKLYTENNGYEGKEYWGNYKNSDVKIYFKIKYFLVDNVLYEITVYYPIDSVYDQRLKQFLDSFMIINQVEEEDKKEK